MKYQTLKGYDSEFIKSITGPNTGKRYHINCALFFDENDGSRQAHISVFDLNNEPIDATVREVMSKEEFDLLKKDIVKLDNLINKLIDQLGI